MENDLPNQEGSDEIRRLTKAERKAKRREEKKQEREKQKRQRKRRRMIMWLSVVVVIAAVVGLIIFLVRDDDGGALGVDVIETDWIRGSAEASVTLVEYSDFECPACAQFQPTVKGVVDELGDKIQFVYRHFPISQSHKQAQLAALAAEAAGRQGKFWEMHDAIFERQGEWAGGEDARDIFGRYAQELELDMTRFDNDIEDNELRDKVEEHKSSGVRSGVSGTPTFFLNGERMKGYNTHDEFKNSIIGAVENS